MKTIFGISHLICLVLVHTQLFFFFKFGFIVFSTFNLVSGQARVGIYCSDFACVHITYSGCCFYHSVYMDCVRIERPRFLTSTSSHTLYHKTWLQQLQFHTIILFWYISLINFHCGITLLHSIPSNH